MRLQVLTPNFFALCGTIPDQQAGTAPGRVVTDTDDFGKAACRRPSLNVSAHLLSVCYEIARQCVHHAILDLTKDKDYAYQDNACYPR